MTLIRGGGRGVSAARNLGFAELERLTPAQESDRSWVMFLDADDRLVPGAIQKLLECLGHEEEQDSECGRCDRGQEEKAGAGVKAYWLASNTSNRLLQGRSPVRAAQACWTQRNTETASGGSVRVRKW